MATARHHARLSASADEVWALVRDPGGIGQWLPGVDNVVVEGDERVVTAMGADIREACTVDDEAKRFIYRIVEAPIPFESHRATIDVMEDGEGCIAVYAIDLEPGDMIQLMEGIAASGIAGLQARFG